MGKPNKFETAAELDTKAKRELYLSHILSSKLSNKEMMDSIDTVKLSEECQSSELLSKEWQQGYECYKSRSQAKIFELLEHLLMTATTRLTSAASLDIGEYIIDEFKEHSLLQESDGKELIEKLKKQSNDLNSYDFAMYDPEMHPGLGEFVKDGKDRLYYWTKENLYKYP